MRSKNFNSPEHRARRKVARDVAAIYFAICRAAGLEPEEAQTCFAISSLLYDKPGQDAATPRKLTLSAIGAALTSQADDKKDKDARWKRAQRNVSHLFCHALPHAGLQLLGRFKAVEDGKAHEYADYAMNVASVVAELFDEERKAILSSKTIKREEMGAAIGAARERLAVEALALFDKLDAAIVGPDRKLFAVTTAPQAKAFCEQNPKFKTTTYTYTPPEPDQDRATKPFYDEDKKRIKEQIMTSAEKRFDELMARNSFDEALLFVAELKTDFDRMCNSWVKVAAAQSRAGKEEDKELIHVSQNGGVGADDDAVLPVENPPEDETATYDILSWVDRSNSFADNTDENDYSENEPVENSPEPASGSVNFDTSLEAALFYARDGWHVLPICNFNPETGRCTAPWHKPDDKGNPCSGKKPLVAGPKPHNPGDGYTAATRDLGKIRTWWGSDFPDAGVGLRLDGRALIDCDVRDGARGLESYEILSNTFALPETLTAITHSSGRHYVFELPDGLPADWLKSWTRPLDKVALGGIDLKVGKCGLLYAEPTRGKKGFYRWVDPTFPLAVLPRAACDFLHEARYKETPEQKAKAARASASASTEPRQPAPFDPDQAKFFKDVPRGERHPRLLKVARACRAGGANAAQIEAALNYHAAHFSDPLSDPAYIARVARECEIKFAPEVAAQ